jgi:hypothetical protein
MKFLKTHFLAFLIAICLICIAYALCGRKCEKNIDTVVASSIANYQKNVVFDEITDLRFRLRSPKSTMLDVANYNKALFEIWLTDSERFNQLISMKHFFQNEQKKWMTSIVEDADPLQIARFAPFELKRDNDYFAVYSKTDSGEELRIRLIKKTGNESYKGNSYRESALLYAERLKPYLTTK